MRPASIVRFEQLYLAAMAAGILADLLSWNGAMAALRGDPQLGQFGPALLVGGMIVTYLAMAALWYFAARRQSVAAKWVISGWFVYSTAMLAVGIFRHGLHLDLVMILGWASYLLRAWSVSYLFKLDADAWFASRQ